MRFLPLALDLGCAVSREMVRVSAMRLRLLRAEGR